jgi:hypothetical protein
LPQPGNIGTFSIFEKGTSTLFPVITFKTGVSLGVLVIESLSVFRESL